MQALALRVAGDVSLFDSRCLHAGGANDSARPRVRLLLVECSGLRFLLLRVRARVGVGAYPNTLSLPLPRFTAYRRVGLGLGHTLTPYPYPYQVLFYCLSLLTLPLTRCSSTAYPY